MKRKFWEDAMNEISDKHIAEAAEPRKKKLRPLWIPALAAVLAVAICVGLFSGRGEVTAPDAAARRTTPSARRTRPPAPRRSPRAGG